MSIILSVLKDELDRNQRMQKAYKAELIEYPKGSLSVKRRGNKNYYYLAFRDEVSQVKTIYIGSENNAKVKEVRDRIEKRKELISSLRKLVIEEEEIRKMLRHDR